MKMTLISCSALTFLAACGGGGSGDPSTQAFTSFSAAPATGTVVVDGNTKSAAFVSNLSGNYDIGTVQSNNDATATVRYRNSLLSRLSLSGTGADVTIDEDSGGQFVQSGFLVAGTTADGSSVIALVDPQSAGFNYQTFGYWENGDTSGNVGVGSFGARTGSTSMPSGTTATYVGASAGLVDTDLADYSSASLISVTTDFSDVTVVSADTELYDIDTGDFIGFASELDFTATGTISGDRFTALINELSGTGAVAGQFYGPGAQEVGGTFEASGSDGTYVGAFGASQ